MYESESKVLVYQVQVRNGIKSYGKFAIFTRLKTEGGGSQRHITKKLPLKIQTAGGYGLNHNLGVSLQINY